MSVCRLVISEPYRNFRLLLSPQSQPGECSSALTDTVSHTRIPGILVRGKGDVVSGPAIGVFVSKCPPPDRPCVTATVRSTIVPIVIIIIVIIIIFIIGYEVIFYAHYSRGVSRAASECLLALPTARPTLACTVLTTTALSAVTISSLGLHVFTSAICRRRRGCSLWVALSPSFHYFSGNVFFVFTVYLHRGMSDTGYPVQCISIRADV